jgi:hypothetical protein
MEVLRERNGNIRQDILVIGKIIVKKVSEFSFMLMVINMRACGLKTRDMVKEHTGEMKVVN